MSHTCIWPGFGRPHGDILGMVHEKTPYQVVRNVSSSTFPIVYITQGESSEGLSTVSHREPDDIIDVTGKFVAEASGLLS